MNVTARQFYNDQYSKFAVYVTSGNQVGWVTDTGAGGTFSWSVDDAKWWNSESDADAELVACDLLTITGSSPITSYFVLRVR